MPFRRQKLYLSLAIMAIGMALAVIWHGWQEILGKTYPYNTFLFAPNSSYSDFTDFMKPEVPMGNYFPSAFLLFAPFRWLPPLLSLVIFEGLCVAGLFFLLRIALRPLQLPRGPLILSYLTLLCSYPVLFCLDRGNIEILLALCMAVSLLFYSRKQFGLSFLILLPAICFKLYPCALLFLFFRRRLLRWILLGVAGFFLINWCVGWIVPQPHETSAEPGYKFAYFTARYVLGPFGISTSADAWNLFRLSVWGVYGCWHGTWAWPLPWNVNCGALAAYDVLALAGGCVLTFYVLLIETSAARKAIPILLYLTVSVPGGGDYKLIHVGTALIVLILLQERRRGDVYAVAALAFCLIPKREILLEFMGNSSSCAPDASIAIILNPLCELSTMLVLMWNGWSSQRLPLPQRLRKLAGVVGLNKFGLPAQ